MVSLELLKGLTQRVTSVALLFVCYLTLEYVMEKLYEIYMHTSPDGKSYIGQTCNRKSRDRDHKASKAIKPFYSAIKLYGWDSFTHTTLAENLTKDEANELEMELIAKHNTIYPNGLNLHKGGELWLNGKIEVNKQYLIDRPVHTRRIPKIEKKKVRPLTESEMLKIEEMNERREARDKERRRVISSVPKITRITRRY